MTGIVILPAGRDDAFEDYKRFVRDGHPIDNIESYLGADDLELFRTTSDEDRVHVWGTSVDGAWRNVERNDIVLVYHDGGFVARGQVLQLRHDPNLAEYLWKENVDHGRWDDESPWEYMTFLTDVEEVDVDIEEFNELVGYDETYRPQGFTRVADKRLDQLSGEESVETAIADLTDAGERVHPVDDEDGENDEDDGPTPNLVDQLRAASTDGNAHEEFEKLVAKAFSRLGCTADWIEGGGDTDVEIRSPEHVVIEVKARGNGRVNSLEVTNVDKHRRQRGADHAIVVAPGFAPKVIDNAETTDLTTLAVDDLVELLDRRDQYAVPPEEILALLTRSGAFQDDRLDLLDESIQDRIDAGETLLAVIRALERADGSVETAEDVRWIVVGMEDSDDVPTTKEVRSTLQLLAHPTIGAVTQDEDGYRVTTDNENGVQLVRSLGDVVQSPAEDGDS
ncbi:restriction endonuclease [Halorubrum sp. BOL3-1]|uniref:restriction endonuclease n=1 Tax=Halorubrum sp. BOL3-1 TaxID=2497325 RepID=UPI0010051CD8|nr:restriction endonuclease [Halorubrum sp. BOL3-1]QAU11663.1 restriction endonuclease [Halorubrum sp. BOL3-1]